MSGVKYLNGRCQHCAGHLEFPADTIGLTAACPHCGQQTELMLEAPAVESAVPRRWLVMTLLAVLILVGGLVACMVILKRYEQQMARRREKLAAVSQGLAQAATTPEQPAGKDGFQVSPIVLEQTPGSSRVYAVGTLKNTTNRQRFGVRVELDLLDSAGQKIGAATNYQPVLEPGAEWRFKALVAEGKTVTAKVAAIQEDH